jgi:hypothetical protein
MGPWKLDSDLDEYRSRSADRDGRRHRPLIGRSPTEDALPARKTTLEPQERG